MNSLRGLFVLTLCSLASAAPAPDVPGIEISELPRPWGDTLAEVHRPDPERKLNNGIGSWAALPPDEQLRADPVLLSPGEGAIFVPTMTQGRVEPSVEVLDAQGKSIDVSQTGQRIRLSPGTYRVRIGSGARNQRTEIRARVVENRTTVLPARWAGLTIHTITPERQAFRGEYKLVRQDQFEAFGEGFGLTEDRVGDIQTWLLPPGVYKLTGLSAGSDDLTNFVTLRLLAGEWIECTLVMDADKVVGGGILTNSSRPQTRDGWRIGMDLGGSITWTREKTTRQENINATQNLTGFTQLRARREVNNWLVSGRIQYVGSATQVNAAPWTISPDELSSQAFVVRRITPRVGPYLRLTTQNHLFPTWRDLTTDTDPLRIWLIDNGTFDRRSIEGSRVKTAAPLFPLELRQGLGLNLDLVQNTTFEATVQGGAAARQVFQGGAYDELPMVGSILAGVQARDSSSNASNSIALRKAQFLYGVGIEATADMRLRLGSFVSVTASPGLFRSFWPTQQVEYSVTTVTSAHLSRHFSLDYRFNYQRALDEIVLHRYPYSHQILLRFSFGI